MTIVTIISAAAIESRMGWMKSPHKRSGLDQLHRHRRRLAAADAQAGDAAL